MELFNRIFQTAQDAPERPAFQNLCSGETLGYGELMERSGRIAARVRALLPDDRSLVVVYGHKSPLMLAAFLGCVRAGHPYCPVDTSMPDERLRDILEVSGAKLLLALEETTVGCENVLCSRELLALPAPAEPLPPALTGGDDVFYVIFTSGSTGKPKGVQITADCLDNYLKWMESIALREGFAEHPVFLNQAPFSFDLSVMDLYTGLFLGGTVCALDKHAQADMELMYRLLDGSGIQVWVSTPSFVNMCLINGAFAQQMLPGLRCFLFCGEVLTNKTARDLLDRFPMARVINTYGPTESTVAVTEVVVTKEMAEAETPLSIGAVKPGSRIFLMDESYTLPGLPEGEKGEIVIAGDTVAKGYLNRPELTAEKFITLRTPEGEMRAYKTGDEGYLRDGLLYYSGRMDFQLKINGYRIELGDIENNLLLLDNVKACVCLPIEKKGVNRGLAAFVCTEAPAEDEFAAAQTLRQQLMERLPAYMVPKKFVFLEDMPKTNNGKVDRRALKERL